MQSFLGIEHLLTRHRYNGMWTRDVQNVVFAVLFCGWLGGLGSFGVTTEAGKLLTIEEVGQILDGTSTILIGSAMLTCNNSPGQS